LFSELAFEVFLYLYFRVTRRFMLRNQDELNTMVRLHELRPPFKLYQGRPSFK